MTMFAAVLWSDSCEKFDSCRNENCIATLLCGLHFVCFWIPASLLVLIKSTVIYCKWFRCRCRCVMGIMIFPCHSTDGSCNNQQWIFFMVMRSISRVKRPFIYYTEEKKKGFSNKHFLFIFNCHECTHSLCRILCIKQFMNNSIKASNSFKRQRLCPFCSTRTAANRFPLFLLSLTE